MDLRAGDKVRIGMLGCAITAERTMFLPMQEGAAITVAAVAARDPARAADYTRENGIPAVFPSYEALLAEADVDAVYVPLPNALHHRWVLAALEAGRHVLCEKPLAVDARQAAEMVAMAEERGLLLVEAFHWRHHPLALRLAELVGGGAIGPIETIDCWFEIGEGNLLPDDIRLSPELGGGSLLDEGCYCIDLIRFLGGGEPSVVRAEGVRLDEGVDGSMRATLALPGGGAARLRCSMMLPDRELVAGARIVGGRGSIDVDFPFLPSFGGRIALNLDGETRVETSASRSSWFYQAEAFAALLRQCAAAAVPSPARSGIANMRLLDDIRAAAGF